MSKFGDFTTALRFREAVTQIAESVVERMRPTYRYAAVMGINHGTRRVTVRFPGESTDVTIAAGSILPSAVGQTVRIAGVGGERYVADVVGVAHGASPFATPRTSLTDPGNAYRNTVQYSSQSLNRHMSSGLYNGDNMGSAPDASWWFIQVITHTNGTDTNGGWTRQVAYGMTGNKGVYTRWTTGADPALAGSWTSWTLIGGEDSGWVEITTFVSGWSSYQVGIGNDWTPRYRKRNGVVNLEGLVNGGPTGTCTTLPVGFRPGTGRLMRAALNAEAGIQRLDITSAGDLYFGAGASTTGWHNIACSFIAEN
jgi:hypothetical protein